MNRIFQNGARCLLLLLLLVSAARAENARTFVEGRSGGGELKYINDLPVLMLAGTPEEMGRQAAALSGEPAKKLVGYPMKMLELVNQKGLLSKFLERCKAVESQLPADHKAEIEAAARQMGVEPEQFYRGNLYPDIYRGGFACSSLIVDAAHSATGGPMFGRNLDYPTLGILDKCGLVTIRRPKGKHAFVTIGFPGMFGCLSGMNDAGLAVAVHEVYLRSDGSPMFNPKGVPYTFCFRRMLEECTTVKEAETLLRSTERTTILNLSVCDPRDAAVFEMTPKTVAVRRGKDGMLACTNHFRTEELMVFGFCRRYPKLIDIGPTERLELDDMAKKLHAVNQGRMTTQTMVFEPAALKLHVAMGSAPSSALPLKLLELKTLFGL
jgi:isopenicillin-N N-acyltransferase like protein